MTTLLYVLHFFSSNVGLSFFFLTVEHVDHIRKE